MRLDKLTTAFQQALAEAQSLAVARDNPYIEPAHVLAAMLVQPDGSVALEHTVQTARVPILPQQVEASAFSTGSGGFAGSACPAPRSHSAWLRPWRKRCLTRSS